MKYLTAPISFAVAFVLVAALGTSYMQTSGGYMAAACALAAIGGAVRGYLLSDRKEPQ